MQTRPRASAAAARADTDGGGRRRLRALVILLALGAVAAWLAAGGVAVASAGGALITGRDLAEDGRAALLDADAAAARDHLAAASEAFAEGEERLLGPAVWPLRAVPVVRANIRAATALAAAGARTAAAGEAVAGALADLPDGVRTLLPRDRTIPLEPLERLAPALERADGLLTEARQLAASAPEQGLVSPVAAARAELLPAVEDVADTTATASRLVEVLPTFLGAEGPKRYLLGAANPAELRGTGGLIGAYALLTVDGGRVDIGAFSSIHDLPGADVDDVPAPNADYAARYNRYGGAGFWQNLNMTPDFPSAATAIETLYGHGTGERLDGTIVVDPHTLAGLLALTGPAEVPGGGTVDADTVVAYIANEAYAEMTDPEARKALLGAVAASALDRFLRGDGGGASPVEAVRALGDAARGGHLLLHSADANVQAAFEDAGVAGALLDPDGDYLAVVVNNAAANKADFFTDRTIHYDVTLRDEGSARATVAVELSNAAPTAGHPAYVIGPNVPDTAAGDNRSLLSVYCAAGCRREGFRRSLSDGSVREETELGHPVFTTMVPLSSGEAERVEIDWSLDTAWEPQDDGGTYRLTVQGQPTIRPTRFVLHVTAPPGLRVASASEGVTVDGEHARWDGPLSGVLQVEIAFIPV